MFMRPYLEKPLHKQGLVEWLKLWALSLSPSTTKKKIPFKREQARYKVGGRRICF
jgi:hypothetical protein